MAIKRKKVTDLPVASSLTDLVTLGVSENKSVKVPIELLKGNKGDKGDAGQKGDAFVYSDFTPEQLVDLKGEKGDKGEVGDKGDAFTYSDFTPEQLVDLKGEKGDKGDKGDKGETGSALTYADLTEAQITELKKPATDAAAIALNLPKIQSGTWWVYNVATLVYVDSSVPATGKSPKIDGGTWWIWNDTTAAYVDSGVPVSSDYTLTKSAVESVLTGDVSSHNHATQLAAALANYVAKVTGKDLSTNDLTDTLLTKLNALENFDDTDILTAITLINERLDTLVSGDASTAIDSFNEIQRFLEGLTDSDSLTGLLTSLKTAIEEEIPVNLSELTPDKTHRTVTDEEKETWNGKQAALTFDTTPTAGSVNPVTSGGVKTAIDTAVATTDKTATIAAANWTLNGSVYQATVSDADILADSRVDITGVADSGSFAAYVEAQIYIGTSTAGQFVLTAVNQPAASITLIYIITK